MRAGHRLGGALPRSVARLGPVGVARPTPPMDPQRPNDLYKFGGGPMYGVPHGGMAMRPPMVQAPQGGGQKPKAQPRVMYRRSQLVLMSSHFGEGMSL